MDLLVPLVWINWLRFCLVLEASSQTIGLVIGRPEFIDREIVIGFFKYSL